MKKAFLIFIINILTILPLTGCWDRRELNEIGIVMAVAIDKDEDGKFIITSQIIKPISSQKGARVSDSTNNVVMVTSKGDTFLNAVRNNAKKFDRTSFFAHVKIIVVSEKVAREGIYEIIDLVSRAPQFRSNIWLLVAKDKKASEMLQIKSGIESIQASYLEGIIKGKKINAEISSARLLDIIKKIQGEGINPVTGAVKIIQDESPQVDEKGSAVRKSIMLSETAVFKKDKLVGYLNEAETRAFNIISENTKTSAIRISSDKDESKFTSILISKIKSDITPYVTNGVISFHINIKATGDILEVQDKTDVVDQEEISKLNDKFRITLEKDIKKCMYKTQNELKTDILGFGSTLNSKYPREWKKVKEQWDTIFIDIPYTINIETTIKDTGLILKPLNTIEK
jgi:spore germination protein KC